MARAFQDTQSDTLPPLEVGWQQRPRARQIPVQFAPVSSVVVEPPRPVAEELTWLPRDETSDSSE